MDFEGILFKAWSNDRMAATLASIFRDATEEDWMVETGTPPHSPLVVAGNFEEFMVKTWPKNRVATNLASVFAAATEKDWLLDAGS